MKKVLLLSLLAMMLISMFVLAACGPKETVEETTTEETTVEEVPAVVDTPAVTPAQTPAPAVTQ